MLDMWTDVFESTGKRTTGTGAQVLAIAGPRWQGRLPAGATLIHSPTAIGWIVGRTQTNGKADYDAVHKFQAGLIATPLSQWGKPHRPPAGKINPSWDTKTPPVDQVEKLSAAAYFSLFTQLTKLNPPHANDYPVLDQMRRIGIQPGKPFAFDKASPEIQRALTGRRPSPIPMANPSAATSVTRCISTRTRSLWCAHSGRSRCTTKNNSLQPIRLRDLPDEGSLLSKHTDSQDRSQRLRICTGSRSHHRQDRGLQAIAQGPKESGDAVRAPQADHETGSIAIARAHWCKR